MRTTSFGPSRSSLEIADSLHGKPFFGNPVILSESTVQYMVGAVTNETMVRLR
jgi:hypothetical protein